MVQYIQSVGDSEDPALEVLKLVRERVKKSVSSHGKNYDLVYVKHQTFTSHTPKVIGCEHVDQIIHGHVAHPVA